MRRVVFGAGLVLVAGCGGGSGGSDAGGTVPDGTGASYGPIQTRGTVNGVPIVNDLNTVSTVALAGVFTDATYRPQGVPDNETALAVASAGGPIDFFMESRERVGSIRPADVEANGYATFPRWSADGQRLYYIPTSPATSAGTGVSWFNPASPATSTSVLSASNLAIYSLSPNETKIAYSRIPTGETDREAFVRGLSGGATTRLTTNDEDDLNYEWLDDNHVAVRRDVIGAPDLSLVYQLSPAANTPYLPASRIPVGRTAIGDLLINNAPTDSALGYSLTQRLLGLNLQAKDYDAPKLGDLFQASISPDGSRWLCAANTDAPTNVFTTELIPREVRTIVDGLPAGTAGAAWQPALGVTKFVGSSGKLGLTAAGIIATYRTGTNPGGTIRNGLSSFVSWTATTPSTSKVNNDATSATAGAKSYVIEADALTSLKYANRPLFGVVSSVSSGGTANGAIVTVDTASGVVRSLVVYQQTRGAKPTIRATGGGRTVEGSLLGVWDAYGTNLAPQGASRVTLDAKGAPTVG